MPKPKRKSSGATRIERKTHDPAVNRPRRKPPAERKALARGPGSPIALEPLLDMACDYIALRKKKWEFKEALRVVFGPDRMPHPSMVEKLLRLGMQRLIDRSKQDKGLHLAEAQAFYEKVIAATDSDYKDKLAAQAGLNAIHGLVVDDKGKRTPEDEAARYRAIVRAMQKSSDVDAQPFEGELVPEGEDA